MQEKVKTSTVKLISYIRCTVTFTVLRSVLLYLRVSRTIVKEKVTSVVDNTDLGHDELLI